jgi:hypothetical protein
LNGEVEELFTDLVESSLGREDGDVTIVSCTSTHDDALMVVVKVVVGGCSESPETK